MYTVATCHSLASADNKPNHRSMVQIGRDGHVSCIRSFACCLAHTHTHVPHSLSLALTSDGRTSLACSQCRGHVASLDPEHAISQGPPGSRPQRPTKVACTAGACVVAAASRAAHEGRRARAIESHQLAQARVCIPCHVRYSSISTFDRSSPAGVRVFDVARSAPARDGDMLYAKFTKVLEPVRPPPYSPPNIPAYGQRHIGHTSIHPSIH